MLCSGSPFPVPSLPVPNSLTHGLSRYLLSTLCIPATVLGIRCSQSRSSQGKTVATLPNTAPGEQATDSCTQPSRPLVLSALEKRKAREWNREGSRLAL